MGSIYSGIKKLVYQLNMHALIKRNVIVLLRTDAMGDFVLWLDAAKEFKKAYPDKKIVVICRNSNAQLARKSPYFDDVCDIDDKKLLNIGYCLRLWFRMLKMYGCIMYQCVYSRSPLEDSVAVMVPAYRKITVDPDDTNYDSEYRKKGEKIYDEVVYVEKKWMMELQRNAEIMRAFGFSDFKSDVPYLPVTMDDFKVMDSEYYVIVLGTANYARAWEVEKYLAVAQWIYEKNHLPCYLLGSPNDSELGEAFCRLNAGIPVRNYIGKTGFLEYIEYIRNAVLVLSGDTSAAHIAAAVRTQSVAIVGGWHFERFLPYDTQIKENEKFYPHVCFHKMGCYYCNRKKVTKQCEDDELQFGKWTCIRKVTVDDVVKIASEVLEE
ncbi:MAG: glycosyltransferase family 9 protein [Lachnospiraceae bacterium]